jgi:TolB-like protein
MNYLFSLLCLLATVGSTAQLPSFNRAHPISWQLPEFNYLPHGKLENVFYIDTIPDYNDGYLAFGRGVICHPDSVDNHTRNFAIKTNVNGDLVWSKRFDEDGEDVNQQWFTGNSGNFGGMVLNHNKEITTCFTEFSGFGAGIQIHHYLTTLDLAGNVLDSNEVQSTPNQHQFFGLLEDPLDSTYVFYGSYRDSAEAVAFQPFEATLLKVDSLGEHIWQESYSTPFKESFVTSAIKALDGGFWVSIQKDTELDCALNFGPNYDIIIVKTDQFGVEEARFEFGGYCGPEVVMFHEYEIDKIIVFGILSPENGTEFFNEGNVFSSLMEQYGTGELSGLEDYQNYFYSPSGSFSDVLLHSDGSFSLIGDAYFDPVNETEVEIMRKGYILRIDINRDSLWRRTYHYYQNDPTQTFEHYAEHYVRDAKITPDNGIIVAGWIEQGANDPNPQLNTPWLFKVDEFGCLEPGCQFVNVEEITIGLENAMTVFPNPVRSEASVRFDLARTFSSTTTELVIIDLQGREVVRHSIPSAIDDQTIISLDVRALSSGIYLVHWVDGVTWLDSVKMVVE